MKNTFDLQHKIRKVSDLVRFIANTSVESVTDGDGRKIGNPNFSILLGAGASISSGIQSGGQLVEKWKREAYEDFEGEKEDCSVDDYFRLHKPEWYDDSNPYSSLFEHRYDLQRQRRIFVEKEVAGKTPSIGYAYLVKLIAAGYFNTIFTTNFDDLLNESFYRFSHFRPVVCAHDSSISGVTITSNRPKIIKLHGDYLFDNIKTTLRETESLETNMQMKFQEFAKDYGLIVIGYSGQDRSIMDILNYLIQQEEYLKNGIYWCIMKDEREKLSGELKKFLWRDKVYIVEIDGFDELMSEINIRLTNDPLPIQTDLMNRRFQERIISDLTENDFIKRTNSPFLLQGLDALKKTYQAESKKDVIEFVKKSRQEEPKQSDRAKQRPELRNSYPEMSFDDALMLENLYNKLALGTKEKEVISQLQSMSLLSLPNGRYKQELIEMYIDINRGIDDKERMKYLDALISLSPQQESIYMLATSRLTNNKNKHRYYEQAIKLFSNDYYVYNVYARFLLNSLSDIISLTIIPNELKQKICSLLDKSIELDSTIENEAYIIKARYYKLIYANQRDRQKTSLEEICKKVASSKMLHHPNYLNILTIAGVDDMSTKYKEAIEFYKKADNPTRLEDNVIQYIQYLVSEGKPFLEIENVYEEYIQDYYPSRELVKLMAQEYKDYEYFEDALSLLNDLQNIPDIILMKMQVMYYMGKKEEFELFYNEIPHTQELCYAYHDLKGENQEALQYVLGMKENSEFVQETDLVTQSFLLLQMEKYNEVIDLLKPYLNETKCVPIILNECYAEKCVGNEKNKIKQFIDTKILKNEYLSLSVMEKVAAYAVLENKQEMLSCLAKLIRQRPIEKYNVSRWPIMQAYIQDPEVQRILTPSPKTLNKK